MRGARLVFAGYALYAAAHRALEFGALAREGVDVDGQVVSTRSFARGRAGALKHQVTYEYRDGTGRVHRRTTRSKWIGGRRRLAGVGATVVALTALALSVPAGPAQARPVRVEQGHPAWWLEITRAWDRFYSLRSYRARVDGPRGETMMWEVVRRGTSAQADDLRMAWKSPDGKYRQETVAKAFELWHVTWIPKTSDPRKIRATEEQLERLGGALVRSAGGGRAGVWTLSSHHVLCVQVPRPVVITAPDSEVRRLLRGAPEAVRVSRRQGTHMGPDRVMRSVTVYEYHLKQPREGWTMPQTIAVDDRTGFLVQATAWVARGVRGPGGLPGGSPFGLPPGGFGLPAGRVPPAGTDWRPELVAFEYYDHNAPFAITVPPEGCR